MPASDALQSRGVLRLLGDLLRDRPSPIHIGIGVLIGTVLLSVWVGVGVVLGIDLVPFLGLTVIGIAAMRWWEWGQFVSDTETDRTGTAVPALWLVCLSGLNAIAIGGMVGIPRIVGTMEEPTVIGLAVQVAILVLVAASIHVYGDLHVQDLMVNGPEPVRFLLDVIGRIPASFFLIALYQQSYGASLPGFTAHALSSTVAGVDGWTWLLFTTPLILGGYALVQLSRQFEGFDSLIPPRIALRDVPQDAFSDRGSRWMHRRLVSESSDETREEEELTLTGLSSESEAATHQQPSTADEEGETADEADAPDSTPTLTFDDVAGMDDLKKQLDEEVITPFGNPEYEKYDIGAVTGVLLYGPPGTGKSYVARATAGELGCRFLSVNTSDVVSDVVGRSVQNLQDVFDRARETQPAVVFLDEIDAIAPSRGEQNMSQSQQQVVNTLLTELSEIDGSDDILVMAATNRPDQLDDALKRSGRFDTTIKIGMPDRETRLAILEQGLSESKVSSEPVWTDVDFVDEFATETAQMSASDIDRVVRRAKREAVANSGDREPEVNRSNIWTAVEKVAEKRTEDAASEYLAEQPELAFDDVGGMDELKRTLEEKVIEPLENPDRFEEYGLSPTNGVLLHGPPGTGKTYVARALAGEAELTLLSISGSDIVSKWVGEAAANVDELFDRAEEVQPCILFIDELDAIAPDRSGQNMSQSQQQMVNELLAGLSDIKEEDVIVIATTNQPDEIDSAVKRAGRMDEQIEVPPPDSDAREAILRVQLDNRPLADDIDWEVLRQMTGGDHGKPLVAADLEQVVDEAARKAMADSSGEGVEPIRQCHLEQAIKEVGSSLNR